MASGATSTMTLSRASATTERCGPTRPTSSSTRFQITPLRSLQASRLCSPHQCRQLQSLARVGHRVGRVGRPLVPSPTQCRARQALRRKADIEGRLTRSNQGRPPSRHLDSQASQLDTPTGVSRAQSHQGQLYVHLPPQQAPAPRKSPSSVQSMPVTGGRVYSALALISRRPRPTLVADIAARRTAEAATKVGEASTLRAEPQRDRLVNSIDRCDYFRLHSSEQAYPCLCNLFRLSSRMPFGGNRIGDTFIGCANDLYSFEDKRNRNVKNWNPVRIRKQDQ